MARVNGDQLLDESAGDELVLDGRGETLSRVLLTEPMDISTKTRTTIDLTGKTFEEINVDGDSRCASFLDRAEGQELVIYLSEGQFVSLQSAAHDS